MAFFRKGAVQRRIRKHLLAIPVRPHVSLKLPLTDQHCGVVRTNVAIFRGRHPLVATSGRHTRYLRLRPFSKAEQAEEALFRPLMYCTPAELPPLDSEAHAVSAINNRVFLDQVLIHVQQMDPTHKACDRPPQHSGLVNRTPPTPEIESHLMPEHFPTKNKLLTLLKNRA